MSDVAENQNSFLTNLTNKLTYKLQEAVYDPKANEYADKKEEQKQEQLNKEKKDETTVNEGDPNKFSGKRLAKKTWDGFVNFLKKTLPYFMALMISMIIANEMIVYAVPVRIIFFIFTFVMTFFNPLALGALVFFYLIKGGYSYFINHMTDGPKRRIMPEIYALLPITTYQPQSTLMRILMYPFYYPKTEIGANELPKIMDDYWKSLNESFKDIEKLKVLPLFAEDLKKAKAFLDRMHLEKKPETTTGVQGGQPTTNNSKNINSKPPVLGNQPAPTAPTNNSKNINTKLPVSRNQPVPTAPTNNSNKNTQLNPTVTTTNKNSNQNPTKINSNIKANDSNTNEVKEVANDVETVVSKIEKEAPKVEKKVANNIETVVSEEEKEAANKVETVVSEEEKEEAKGEKEEAKGEKEEAKGEKKASELEKETAKLENSANKVEDSTNKLKQGEDIEPTTSSPKK